MSAQGSFFYCNLPDGSRVDLFTAEGVHRFLRFCPASWLSQQLVDLKKHRKQYEKKPHSKAAQQDLHRSYALLSCITDEGPRETLLQSVDEKDVDEFLQHILTFTTKIKEQDVWKEQGDLKEHDYAMLGAVTNFAKHQIFCEKLHNSDYCKILAEVYAAASDITADTAEVLCGQAMNLIMGHENHEKVFRILEESGLLAQVFRAVTYPLPTVSDDSVQNYVLGLMGNSQSFIRKKLRAGTPTGDFLLRVIEGEEGFKGPRSPGVVARLKNLSDQARMITGSANGMPTGLDTRSCRNCNKTELDTKRPMLVCSKCKSAYYCVKACQIADWKLHKQICKATMPRNKKIESMVSSFVLENRTIVLDRFARLQRSTGLVKSEMVLELDFVTKAGEASSPALRKEFKVVPASDYLNGSRPTQSDWVLRDTGGIDLDLLAKTFKDQYDRMTPEHVLCFTRYSGGYFISRFLGQSLVPDEMAPFHDQIVTCISESPNPGEQLTMMDKAKAVLRMFERMHGGDDEEYL